MGETEKQRLHLLEYIKLWSRTKGNVFTLDLFIRLLGHVRMLKVLAFTLDCVLHASPVCKSGWVLEKGFAFSCALV